MNENLVEVKIKDLAFDGKAVGEMDGKIIFLNGGLPGETVLAQITKQNRRFNQGSVKQIIHKSDKRIDPKCIHFDQCGGCTWQDLIYQEQLFYKQKQVNDCLNHIARLDDVKVEMILPSQKQFHYRNKMEYSFHNYDDHFTLGLHKRGAFDEIFNLEECHIGGTLDSDIVRWMHDYVKKNNIPVYDVFRHTGYIRFLMIRSAANTDDLMINVVTNYGDFPKTDEFIEAMTNRFPMVTTIVHNQNGQKSNIATGEIEKVIFGSGIIKEKIMGKTFLISSNSFFQTNTDQAELLYKTGFDMLKPNPEDNILDLYCGTGTIGILAAERVSKVIGVELVADAVKKAQENAALNNIDNISFIEGHVKDVIRENLDLISNFKTIIVDPPRAGLNTKTIKQLLKINPDKILYISCNPATFARDAKDLVAAGYELPQIKPVDMFPHTKHIELVSVFYR